MRARTWAAGGIAVIAAAAAVAVPAGADSGGYPPSPTFDMVVGAGLNNPANPDNVARFEILAISGPNGENAFGHAKFTTLRSKASQSGPVQCLRVDGNRATAVVLWTKLKKQTTENPRAGAIIFLEDNGKRIEKGKPVDDIRSQGFLVDDIPSECPPPEDLAEPNLTKGAIKIVDGS
jgi:hypothetical protein